MPAVYEFHQQERCNMCGEQVPRVLGKRLSTHQGVRPTRKTGTAVTVVRCRCCGLVYANPMPVPVDIAQHYGQPPQDYWRRNTHYFDHDPGYFADAIGIYRDLSGNTAGRVLDVGAGIGKCMRSLQDAGLDAYGIEPGTAFRAAAVDHNAIDPDRIQLADIEHADWEAGSFDFVTFGAVLEHIPDPAAALQLALGWCKPGGLVQVEVPSSDWLTARVVNATYRLQGLDYVTNLSPMHEPFHLYEFTPRSFEVHAQRNGHTVALVRELLGHETFLPGPARVWHALMKRTHGGYGIEVWLRS